MLRFENDYAEGCIEEILEKIVKTNMEQTPGYRLDPYCESAEKKIKSACKKDSLDVHFLVGGTQTNMTVIESLLRPRLGMVCPVLGHINVHEAGAIESTGHKVIAIENESDKFNEESKLDPTDLERYLTEFFDAGDWHKVQPGGVYISHPTERGALYTKKELMEIKRICEKFDMPLFLDGARLSYAMASERNDITFEDLARYTDVFYIGGTKCGALFGEAICFTNDRYNRGFSNLTKGNGAVLAKGRLFGIQFDELFSGDTYVEKSRDAVRFAISIKKAFEDKNIDFLAESFTNQQFPILTKEQQEHIRSFDISFNFEKKIDENRDAVRFCTSWATDKKAVDELLKAIASL